MAKKGQYLMYDKGDIFPDVIRIEPSGICNFNCKHCSNWEYKSPRKLMDINVYIKLLDSFRYAQFTPRVIVLYHGGEPLVNPQTADFVAMARDFGVKTIKIVSNASLLTEDMSKKLIEAGLTHLEVSFDGNSMHENNYIRENADFERDSENVINFLRINNNRVKVSISNTQIATKKGLLPDIESKPEYLIERFSDWIDELDFKIFPAMVWPDFKMDSSPFKCFTMKDKNDYVDYCPNLFETITVLSNGDVVPCCYDLRGSVVFGNILDTSIFDIWKSKQMSDFRDSIKKGQPNDLCSRCMVFIKKYLMNDVYYK